LINYNFTQGSFHAEGAEVQRKQRRKMKKRYVKFIKNIDTEVSAPPLPLRETKSA